MQRWCII